MNSKKYARLVLLPAALAMTSYVAASEELAQTSNCLACHAVDNKVIGPAFVDIAAKYKDDSTAVDTLIDKVKNGGTGNWGQIPMPPNPALSDEDARALVEWVMSL
jgi:cytochrome c551/c552